MHEINEFIKLIELATNYTTKNLEETENKIMSDLETNASNSLVRSLRVTGMLKSITAIGIFSMFEASLQDGLNCADGFLEVKIRLKKTGNHELLNRFNYFNAAINVLKHGRGRSYDFLTLNHAHLPFRVKLLSEAFFDEGIVSEISTLVDADNAFLLSCASLIREISNALREDA